MGNIRSHLIYQETENEFKFSKRRRVSGWAKTQTLSTATYNGHQTWNYRQDKRRSRQPNYRYSMYLPPEGFVHRTRSLNDLLDGDELQLSEIHHSLSKPCLLCQTSQKIPQMDIAVDDHSSLPPSTHSYKDHELDDTTLSLDLRSDPPSPSSDRQHFDSQSHNLSLSSSPPYTHRGTNHRSRDSSRTHSTISFEDDCSIPATGTVRSQVFNFHGNNIVVILDNNGTARVRQSTRL